MQDTFVKSSTKVSTLTEELSQTPVIPAPKLTTEPDRQPIGRWGSSKTHPNAWFTDGSSSVTNGRISWKAAAFRPSDRKILTREGSRQSAQIAELQAVKLAVEQSIKEGQKHVHIFSDSWAVCNGIAIWSAKWRANSYTINNKPVWGQDAWLFLDQAPISIFVTHVDAHTNKTTFEAENNAIADRLAKVNIAIKLQNTAPWRSTITEKRIKLKRDPNWQ